MQTNKRSKKSYHNISWMDIPFFSGDGMSGTSRRHITNYGTSKYDMEEVSRHFCREPIGLCRWEHTNTKSHSWWHSGEGNYKDSRDPSDAKMAWEGKSSYEKSQKKSYRSRSRSPAYRFDRASVNDRRGRITTYNFRNDKPRSTSTIPCKFFATGNCRNGSFCRFSHNDRTLDSFSNYKADHVQGTDSRIYRASPRALDTNVSPCLRDENEGLGEQRAVRSYADDNAAPENSLIAHRMDSDEPTKDNGRSHLTLTAHSSSGMVVSESRGTATRGTDIEGSMTSTDNHLPTLNGTSRKPDVLDTVKSEAALSNQCQMGSEQMSRLTNTLVPLLEDRKQLSELRAALSALNALGFMQSFLSVFVGPDVPASSSNQYDPVTDSLELVKSVVSEQTSQLLLTGSRGGDGLHGIDCKKAELNVNSLQSTEKALSADCKNEEQSILTLVQLLEDGKKLPELRAALSALNALGFMQYFLSASAGPDVPSSSSNQYDPVTDSLELVKSVVSEQTSQLLLTGSPGGDGLHGIDCKKAELNVNSLQSTANALSADCKNEEQSILMAAEMKEGKGRGKLANNEGVGKAAEIKKNNDGKNLQTSRKAPSSDCKSQEHIIVKVEKIKKGKDRGKLVNNEGDDKAGEIKKNNDGKSLRPFKFALAEFVKELLRPTWKEGHIKKEAYKTIVKNVVDKVIASVQSIHILQTKEKIDNYLSTAKPEILKLLQAYLENGKDEQSNTA